MGFSIGFADELEKLALRLPSIGQMTSGFGSEPGPAPSAVSEPAAAAPPQQNVHVHVHHQAKKVAPAAAPAAAKPQQTSKGIDMPSSDAPATGLPPAPAFGADSKAAPKSYTAAGPTPGRHTAGHAAPKGTVLPSEMRVGPRPITDLGEGPQTDHTLGLTLHDFGQGLATAAGAPTDKDYADTDKKDAAKSTAGFQMGKAPPPKFAPQAPAAAPMSAGSQNFQVQPMAPAPKPARKKMFGTALASNDEPAKM